MFDKILIANRGEIACRIIATCRKLGVRTVAVHSEADAEARHVRLADEAVCIGPAASSESYLRADKVIAAAKATGAQAVHPGYGFLSENEGFAESCAAAGIVFIGPPVSAIRAMGSKSAAKALMEKAKVPLVPGYHGDEQTPDFLREQANRIGYPVLLKASAGGGGKGMRVVEREADFETALASCQREARASFGDDKVLVEKYLQKPRHIEVQVFGDTHGNVVFLHERDCSAQRRHQKVVEEAPAPGIDQNFRDAIGKAAVNAAQAVGYVGAGTVEFIEEGGTFYFMEMNTRLQVEHPVTEMITGQDLVEWQLRIACGEPLPLKQEQIPLRGHSIEVRIYAEVPEKGFLPSIGTLQYLRTPVPSKDVRIDSGVEQGDAISPFYDPMIAKLIVHGDDRDEAIARMLNALRDFRIVGVGNNIGFLSKLIDHAEFRAGGFDTGLIGRELAALTTANAAFPPDALHAAALFVLDAESRTANANPWSFADGWRINGEATRRLEFTAADDSVHAVEVAYAGNGAYRIDGEAASVRADAQGKRCIVGARQFDADVVADDAGMLHVFTAGIHVPLSPVDKLAHAGVDNETQGGLIAPMPGKIIAVMASDGAQVEKGAPLLVMEAMKMEYTISAPANGTVTKLLCKVGDLVADKTPLVEFEASK